MIIYTGNYAKRRKRLLTAILYREDTSEEAKNAMRRRITELWHNQHHQSRREVSCRLCND